VKNDHCVRQLQKRTKSVRTSSRCEIVVSAAAVIRSNQNNETARWQIHPFHFLQLLY